jgi:mycothiol synthase
VNALDAGRTTAVLAAAQHSLEVGEPVPVEDIERRMTGDEQLIMRKEGWDRLEDLPAPPGYGLRTFRPADARAWLDICNPAIGTTWTEAEFGEKMLHVRWFSPDRVFIVTDGNGQPVGTACAWQDNEEEREAGYTHMVAVRPEHRGRGLGRVLMQQVLIWFRDHGFRSSLLNTDDFRLPAIALYQDLGFQPVVKDDFHRRRWEAVNVALESRGDVKRNA